MTEEKWHYSASFGYRAPSPLGEERAERIAMQMERDEDRHDVRKYLAGLTKAGEKSV